MKNVVKGIIEKIPFPAAGMALGFATLGNMLYDFFPYSKLLFGSISITIFICVSIKLLLFKEKFTEDMKNPLIATNFPAYDMCLMVLMTYLKPYLPSLSLIIWLSAIILHFVFLAYLTKKFIAKLDINLIFASYFVAFVGLGTATITSPIFNMEFLGKCLFYFSFTLYLLFIPFVLYRVINIKKLPENTKPSCAIIASPGSLCLTGYLSCFSDPSHSIVAVLAVFCMILIPAGYFFCIFTNKKTFYPSYSSYTFPFVVSAFAAIKLRNFASVYNNYSTLHSVLSKIIPFMIGIALCSCLYVLARYLLFVFADGNRQIISTQQKSSASSTAD